jgi:hypothetical protein
MGVMSCSRKNCERILCDTYVDDIGYICYDCQQEFKDYIAETGIGQYDDIETGKLLKLLKEFMETPKDTYKKEITTVNDFFTKNTKN